MDTKPGRLEATRQSTYEIFTEDDLIVGKRERGAVVSTIKSEVVQKLVEKLHVSTDRPEIEKELRNRLWAAVMVSSSLTQAIIHTFSPEHGGPAVMLMLMHYGYAVFWG